MKVLLLGTGTSSGIPVPTCQCSVCNSADKKNSRLRTSAYLSFYAEDSEDSAIAPLPDSQEPIANLLIDSGPDLRYQLLRAKINSLQGVLYTHAHADHIFGIDDLRCFNFTHKRSLPLFAAASTADYLKKTFKYCFETDLQYEGGSAPDLELQVIEPYVPFSFHGVSILPLPVLHGKHEILGFRIGSFAYLTDCSVVPERTKEHLRGLDILILDGLRMRPHRTHFTIPQAVTEAESIRARKTYLIHLSHEIDHATVNEEISQQTEGRVELAYDGLSFTV